LASIPFGDIGVVLVVCFQLSFFMIAFLFLHDFSAVLLIPLWFP
jgi:hypothetical protein